MPRHRTLAAPETPVAPTAGQPVRAPRARSLRAAPCLLSAARPPHSPWASSGLVWPPCTRTGGVRCGPGASLPRGPFWRAGAPLPVGKGSAAPSRGQPPGPGSAVGRGPDAVSLAVHGLPRERHRQSHVRVQSAPILLPALGLRLPVSTKGPCLRRWSAAGRAPEAGGWASPCPGALSWGSPAWFCFLVWQRWWAAWGQPAWAPGDAGLRGNPSLGSGVLMAPPALWRACWAAAPACGRPGSVPRAWTWGGLGAQPHTTPVASLSEPQCPCLPTPRAPLGSGRFQRSGEVPGVRWGGPHVGLSTSGRCPPGVSGPSWGLPVSRAAPPARPRQCSAPALLTTPPIGLPVYLPLPSSRSWCLERRAV